MLVSLLLLGGLLPLGPRTRANWTPSGAWRYPVGDPYFLSAERSKRAGPFFLLRSVAWDGERASHQGADIGSGRSGALVRAAAAGVVVRVADHGWHGGYGTHVVLAHRLPEGVLMYSVYAHLRLASIRVRAGRTVQAGTALGRVGATGRATTPHLHFEIRTAGDPEERWEFARVEDPLAFIDERLPAHRADSSGVAAYLEWAECAALMSSGAHGDDALTRETWWRMLAAGVRGPHLDLTLPTTDLLDSLRSASVLPNLKQTPAAGAALPWLELARDLARARTLGVRTGHGPLRRRRHREVCAATLGSASPMLHLGELSGRPGKPSHAEAVLLFADLAGPAPEPPKPAKKRAVPASPPKPVRPPTPATDSMMIAAPADSGS